MARFSYILQLLWLCLTAVSHAVPSPENDSHLSKRASNACGQVVNAKKTVFTAKLVYDCLVSVPFNPAVATRFINYYNESMQFQSTLAYLKNPPASYQQPPVDFMLELGRIQTAINKGLFKNQYEFEATLLQLIYSAHDTHVDLVAGIMGVFSFGTQYSIVSLSSDGVQLPKIYLSDDVIESQSKGAKWKASAITKINDLPVLDYLMDFASVNAFGTLEAHADFNQLMTSPAQDIQAVFNTWGGGAAFYPGETLKMVLENGTTITTPWLAVYNSPGATGPLETGGDFYNFFVLGFYPDSYDPYAKSSKKNRRAEAPTSASSSSNARLSSTQQSSSLLKASTSSPASRITSSVLSSVRTTITSSGKPVSTASSSRKSASTTISRKPSPSSWKNDAYPLVPDVVQPDLGTFGGGFISGYFIGNGTAVLSIPSFVEIGAAEGTFSDTIALFLKTCVEKRMKKLVIDLQQNSGGDVLLAFDTFKRFFPNLEPFGGSRMRAHKAANAMGDAITSYWKTLTEDDDDYYNLVADEWMVADRINADTKKNFTSWAEHYGPHLHNGDNFTTTQQYNLSSYIFGMAATRNFDEYFAVYGYGGNPAPMNATAPFKVSDIVILSDGICASACAIFMHMMHSEAGVKTVVAGGYPMNGPMQAPAGTRGARAYSVTETLDNNILYAQEILQDNNDPRQNFLPNRADTLGDYYIDFMGINLRDQIKKSSDVPLQFLYEAANCRIFYTPSTFYNYTALWKYAADAIWTNPSLCVKGSTGYATTNGTAPPTPILPSTTNSVIVALPSTSVGALIMKMLGATTSSPETEAITATKNARSKFSFEGEDCSDSDCTEGYFCTPYSKTCGTNGKPIVFWGCAIECKMYPGYCKNGGTCQPYELDTDGIKDTKAQLKITPGYCSPKVPTCVKSTSGKKKTKYGKAGDASGGYKKKL